MSIAGILSIKLSGDIFPFMNLLNKAERWQLAPGARKGVVVNAASIF